MSRVRKLLTGIVLEARAQMPQPSTRGSTRRAGAVWRNRPERTAFSPPLTQGDFFRAGTATTTANSLALPQNFDRLV